MKHAFSAAIVLFAGSTTAQPFEITSSTIDGGGGTLRGGSYTLSGTIGQPDAGSELAGATFVLTGGFWVGQAQVPVCLADVNGNGVADPGDFTAWIVAYNTGDPAADQNGNGSIEPGDFTAWVVNYNLGC